MREIISREIITLIGNMTNKKYKFAFVLFISFSSQILFKIRSIIFQILLIMRKLIYYFTWFKDYTYKYRITFKL